MTERSRVEIPTDVAAQVLFESDRTCVVCREKRKPVQIHHIDGNPANNVAFNLAVLCIECHRETQIRGGFDRKLDAAQIALYKTDWITKVADNRSTDHSANRKGSLAGARAVRYMQSKEASEEHSYTFEAEYPQVDTGDSTADAETNLCISAFITHTLQRFRADAISRKEEKDEMKRNTSLPRGIAWDDLSISHIISLYTSALLTIEFNVSSYYAMAMHPNTNTYTLNFRLHPSLQLELMDIFKPESNYLKLLSQYCVRDLHRQQPSRFHDSIERAKELENEDNWWILSGAGQDHRNYERFVIVNGGVRVFFDPYQVGSYAEGRYEVFVPKTVLSPILSESIISLMS